MFQFLAFFISNCSNLKYLIFVWLSCLAMKLDSMAICILCLLNQGSRRISLKIFITLMLPKWSELSQMLKNWFLNGAYSSIILFIVTFSMLFYFPSQRIHSSPQDSLDFGEDTSEKSHSGAFGGRRGEREGGNFVYFWLGSAALRGSHLHPTKQTLR